MKWWNRNPNSWPQRKRRFRRFFAKIIQELTDRRVPAVAVARPRTGALDSRRER